MMRISAVLLLSLLLATCADRQHRNPLDPEAADVAFVVGELEARAGDGQVELHWDFSRFDDITGVRLSRQTITADSQGQDLVRNLPREVVEFIDEEVMNGTTYSYQLAIVVEGEGERSLERTRFASPGTESGWVADVGSNRVWKLAPDSRSSLFGKGPFPDIQAIALNWADGSCWVSDRFLGGIVRIAPDGRDELLDINLSEPGDLSIAPDPPRGWVVDSEQRRVFSFELEIGTSDSADVNEVDASFAESVVLSATSGGCWIGDRAGSRIILAAEDGSRAAEWHQLEQLGPIAAGPSATELGEAEAWALIRDGGALIHLAAAGSTALEVELPFSAGVALDVDAATGNCWVLGEQQSVGSIATFDRNGTLLRLWEDLPLLHDLAVDGDNRQIWLAGGGVVWKRAIDADEAVHLRGFGQSVQIEVDPGNR